MPVTFCYKTKATFFPSFVVFLRSNLGSVILPLQLQHSHSPQQADCSLCLESVSQTTAWENMPFPSASRIRQGEEITTHLLGQRQLAERRRRTAGHSHMDKHTNGHIHSHSWGRGDRSTLGFQMFHCTMINILGSIFSHRTLVLLLTI